MTENVLLITIDSLRYDSLPGSNESSDSILRELHESSTSFNNAFATGPGTTPSFPGILTGTLPLSHGGLGPLSDSRPHLSSNLNSAGLNTAGFQCNPFLSSHFNYDVGFDRFKDYQNPLMGIATKIFPRGIEINNPKLRRIDRTLHITDLIKKSYQIVKGKPRPYVNAEVITDDTVEWLSQTNSPFFCWTHYMDVHHPCYPPEVYRRRHSVGQVSQTDVSELYSDLLRNPESLGEPELKNLKRLYRAAIDYVDVQIRRIIDHLKTTGQSGNTLVVITSDHGELFGEYGEYGKPERMYDELLHVPLIVMNGPDFLKHATNDLVSLLDLPPLIHEVLGLDIPTQYEGVVPGRAEKRNHVLAEHEVEGDVIVGARSNDWLYEIDEIVGEHRLFDLRNEGFERTHPDNPEAEVPRKAVQSRLAKLDINAGYLQQSFDEDVEDRLEDLGYL